VPRRVAETKPVYTLEIIQGNKRTEEKF
jgi:hypothetical protein